MHNRGVSFSIAAFAILGISLAVVALFLYGQNPTGYALARTSGCADSDGGLNPNVKGTVIAGERRIADSCASAVVLIEGYCKGSTFAAARFSCDCTGGVCANKNPPTDMQSSQNTAPASCGVVKIGYDGPCGSARFRKATWQCQDGITLYNEYAQCTSASIMRADAAEACKDRCKQ